MKLPTRRTRLPLTLDPATLRRLADMIRPGSGARLELVMAKGRRMRLARGLDPAGLALLIRSAARQQDARLELVQA